ncbi:TPA: hypothetical protein ACPZMC_000491 [Yersinia enterocolitica]|uniref:RipA family octameric membrane protein n=1 Tax=Yersinia enterocolitica TaxID=630 RepID=UPI0030CA6B0E
MSSETAEKTNHDNTVSDNAVENKNEDKYKSSNLYAIKRLYELTIRVRDFEITQLSQRNNFFMLFQGVLFAGLATLLQNSSGKDYAALVCFIGLFVSMFQIGISSGAKYWQEFWEESVRKTEIELIKEMKSIHPDSKLYREKVYKLFSIEMSEVESCVRKRLNRSKANWLIKKLILAKFSVSRIPIWAGIFFFVAWLSLLIWFLLFSKIIIIMMI